MNTQKSVTSKLGQYLFSKISWLVIAASLVASAAAPLVIPKLAYAASTNIVISQVYGGAGCGTVGCSTYKNDYVELFNLGSSAQSINGWSIQYGSATGTGAWTKTDLPNVSIPAGSYFLLSLGAGVNGVSNIPTADAVGSTALSATAGKLALVSNTTALNGACPVSTNIIDQVGYGTTANCSETAPAPAPSTVNAIFRTLAGCTDTDNNSTNFSAAAASPRNSATAAISCSSLPTLSIDSVTVAEGNSGTTAFTFTISLSAVAAGNVSFNIATTAGTATAGSDFTTNSATAQTITAGNLTSTFTVLVNGDTLPETNETFSVTISSPTGATIPTAGATGTGTITNDDAAPNLSINSVSQAEGNTTTSFFNFTVSLSAPAPAGGVTFDIATADGTASAGSDYVANSIAGQTIAAGNSSATFAVTVNGDTVGEANETFTVNVTNITNAIGVTTTGNGTIANDDITRISAVQGAGTASPLVGTAVLVEGIVTGVFQGASSLAGFFMQEEDVNSDANPATSEGIFVYTNTVPATVAVGDKVRVAGNVIEFGTAAQVTAGTAFTEITTPTVTFISANNPLPTAATVTLPVAAIGDLERFEGMRVNFTQPLTVTDNNSIGQFGELTLSVNGRLLQPTSSIDPNDAVATGTTSTGTSNAGAIAARNSLNSRSSIILDDGSTAQYPAIMPFIDPITKTIRVGSTITSFTGILSQSFGTHRLLAPTAPVINYAERPLTPPAVGGNVKIAGANVLNYFNGDGAGNTFPTSRGANSAIEFARQRAKTIVALNTLNADVVALLEIENENNTATSSLVDLLAGLNAAAGAGTWAGVERPVGYSAIDGGTDVIRPAFIYKPAVVTPVGLSTALNDPAFAVSLGGGRAPIAQVFKLVSNNEQFVVVANHFKSKSSSGATGLNTDQNDGQAAFNQTRRLQATALLGFITTLAANTPRVITLGDFNAYEEEDPLDIFRVGGLTNAITSSYSYVFGGLTGSLDHAFVNAAMLPTITGSGKWHINADEPEAIDYNVERKNTTGCTTGITCTGQDLFDGSNPFRASDHDPIIVGLQLGVNPPPPPVPVTVSVSVEAGSTGFGSISPAGNNTVFTGQKLALSITANPRYLASLSGTCGTVVTSPPVPFVPQGAGTFSAETNAVNGDCSVVLRFTAVTPQLRLGTALAAAPAPSTSIFGQVARFTATLYGAVGANASTFGFFADGAAIPNCTAVATNFAVSNDVGVRVATCETTSLAVGSRAITAVYGGDIYNFGALADASITPDQTQTHVVMPLIVMPPVLLSQTITLAPISGKQFGTAPFSISASASSGLTVTINSTTPSICTVAANTVSIAASGTASATCSLSATQAGNATFAAATPVAVSFAVAPAVVVPTAQTITVAAIAAQIVGGPAVAVTATASSGLPVTLVSLSTTICAVAGNTVTSLAAGSCSLSATQPGNATFAAAPPVAVSFAVTPAVVVPTAQTITVAAIAAQIVGGPAVAVTATASSGLPVTLVSLSTNICTVAGNSVTSLAAGSCSLSATQAGNATFAAATPVAVSFVVTPAVVVPTAQTITVAAIAAQIVGGPAVAVTATASSGLPVNVVSLSTTICTVAGNTVTSLAAGSCSLSATQAGNATFAAATPVAVSFAVTPAVVVPTAQTITVAAIAAQTVGGPAVAVTATASSGLPVTVVSLSTTICTVAGNTVTSLAAGSCSLSATQAGNATFAAAPPVAVSFAVTPAVVVPTAQTITVAAIAAQIVGGPAVAVTATASSGLPVTLVSLSTNICTVAGNSVTSLAAGSCSLSATQAGNATFAAATPVAVSFVVTPAVVVPTAQTITVAAIAAQIVGGPAVAVTATASSGLPVNVVSLSTTICTVAGNTVTSLAAGSCSLSATQAGNAIFAAAPPVAVSFAVIATPVVADTTPNAFSFVAALNQPLGLAAMRSNTITITGIDAAAPISILGGEYSIGCTSDFTASSGTIINNQAVCVRHVGAATEGASVTTSLTIGGVTGAFSSTTAVVTATSGQRFPLYRLYNTAQQRHFFTTSETERTQLIAEGWQAEGIVAQLLEKAGTMGGVATQPLMRLYNPSVNYHFWTSDTNEYAVLATRGWIQQGIVGYLGSAPNPLGIKFNRLLRQGGLRHLFTTDQNEAAFLVKAGSFIDEGVIGYALK